MTQKIQEIFKKMEDVESSAGLEGKILKKIAHQKGWSEKKRLIRADALMLFSAGIFVFAILNFWEGIVKSEFWSLSNFLLSDPFSVAAYWKDFLFSLLETFPAGHLAAILAPVFFVMVSLKMYFSNGNFKHSNN